MHCTADWFKFIASSSQYFKLFQPTQTSRTLPPIRCCRRLVGRASPRCLGRQDAGSTLGLTERVIVARLGNPPIVGATLLLRLSCPRGPILPPAVSRRRPTQSNRIF